jgi:Zn-dependent M16 (insulinase) family peptidase
MYARRSLSGYIDEISGGITYFEALPGLIEMAEKDWPQLHAKLVKMNALILQKKAIMINLSGDKATLQKVDSHADKFVKSLLATSNEPWYATLAKSFGVMAIKEGSNETKQGPLVSDAIKGKPNLRLAQEDEGFVFQLQ